ncbi:two-component sensor histidine kinase [Thalassomonas viridans]|uniref:histidine kinase n=1 Tax=Thalassomonas viridans TaxID=137584 RepID=A0AAE9Z6Y9_9GAMM|nr:ATP-binding protein [Thalassomonas viridans]WDE07387.1 two-component sensor histidine kinase [Thalassomonas viridans]
MRTLAAILYLIIVGCLILATYATESLVDSYYQEEISEEYRQYSQLLTLLIGRELTDNKTHNRQRLAYWRNYLDEEVDSIEIIPLPDTLTGKNKSQVEVIDISDQTDNLVVISALQQPGLDNKALKYNFISSYTDEYITAYYLSVVAIYFFLALVISLVSWGMYRYLKQISTVTRSLASGNFTSRMPGYRIPALDKLSKDINYMATALEDKTQENIILTGAIHHELRIPVTRLRLALDIALSGGSQEGIQELLLGMDEDLEELSSLMEEILTISRLRLNSVEIAKEEVDLAGLIQQTVEQLTGSVSGTNISINTKTHYALQANPTLLERALFNVVSNGVKYCRNKVEITLTREKDQIILSVADDGPGIEESEKTLILKPFYRTDKSRTRNTGGFGLGLAIANMVIKDTQGRISISDSPLGGAQINLHWPASTGQAPLSEAS